jgi:two-component system, NarL family, response regulator
MIVDDHPVVVEGLAALLGATTEFVVARTCSSGEEAVACHVECRPDVTIIDLRLGGITGVEAIRQVRLQDPQARFVVMTSYDGDENVYRAFEAGACGYILKSTLRQELFAAIRAAHRGQRHLAPALAGQLALSLPRTPLTPRESEVLESMARGMGNKEIGVALDISEETVKAHVKAILAKLNAADRTEAVVTAFKRGFLLLQ